MHSPRWLSSALYLALAAALAASCAADELERDRVGGPLPVESEPVCDPADASTDAASVSWCEAFAIIQRKCQRCHADPPENGAPFSLMEYSDTQVLFGKRRVWRQMRDAVASGAMPFVELTDLLHLDPPVEDLTPEEKATLIAWLDQCAQAIGGLDCSGSDAAADAADAASETGAQNDAANDGR
jgi:uncharacterized membrane protein